MVMSMTGFGTGKAEGNNREITIELKTVNNRYLDINLRMPRALSVLEESLRKRIQQKIARGRVEVYISYQNNSQEQVSVSVNEPVAEAYYKALTALAGKFQLDMKPDLGVLADIDDIFIVEKPEEDEELLKELLFSALDEALNAVIKMRKQEGSFLAEDLKQRSLRIENMVKQIEQRSSVVVEEYRQKLEQRLKEMLNNTELDEARFQAEVVYFADRSNITEEIVRIRSHLDQLRQTLESGGSIGRKLDFIVQELNRETNTIGSKSSDVIIANYVVEIKSELEKIREQVQNIE
ncbi:MAG: YicC family protein [Clostridiales bacterium]|nr:YicC family protein [Clostridiales bacterium]